ncbi:hypothetical protein TNCV_1311521 [Trichonephila clavipes]|nr:hypothetical protein TNCV_1311521 [Trichonephila clavipes]
MNKIRKTPGALDCSIVLLENFIAVEDDHVYTAPIIWQTSTFGGLLKANKNTIDAVFDDLNKMNNAAPVLTSSEMRNVMKNMCLYLDAHSNGEMNNKMGDFEQPVENLTLKKQCIEKYQIILQKLIKSLKNLY